METKYFQIWVKAVLSVSGSAQEESTVLVVKAGNFGEAYVTAQSYNKEIVLISEITKETYDVMQSALTFDGEGETPEHLPEGGFPNVES